MKTKKSTKYPEPKTHNLSPIEKDQIRKDIALKKMNIYEIAILRGCSSSQVAGIKAAITKGR